MAAIADERSIKLFALANDFLAHFLLGGLRHRRDHHVRIGERHVGAELEGIEARRPAFGFGRGHGASGCEQSRARTPSDRSDDVLLAVHGEGDGN